MYITCRYPKPSIADFVGYDQKIKIYTHEEICKNNYNTSMFQAVRISNDQTKPAWVSKIDFEIHNLQKWSK